jgi:hypothetical protein
LLGSKVFKDGSVITDEIIDARIPEYVKLDGVNKKYSQLNEHERKLVRDRAAMDAIAELMMPDASDSEDGDDQRDIMGEMEIIATLMITGGEEEEAKKLTRADRRMIRDAILHGARKA